jgi:cytochrome c oxidase assembly protein subunit 15
MIAVPQSAFATSPRVSALGDRSRLVAIWLMTVAVLVLAMVVVGGATRLTGSGLSITEWKPLSGAAPPLTDRAWADLFRKYQATSQYRLINQGLSLAAFKPLFWWEWGHRLLARAVGLVFAGPFVVLLVLRRVPPRLIWRCGLLLALGGLQGLVGWWMVESGLEGRASVAPERLAVHLGLALALLMALVWTALEAWTGPPDRREHRRLSGRWLYGLFAAGVFLQCLMGALVAGNGGGLVDNDWPLMGGRLTPDDYWRGGLWATLAHGPSAAQFNHRLLAYALLAGGAVLALASLRSGPGALARLALACLGLLTLQATLGVTTLLWGDPPALALAHQANAAILLAAAAALAWRARRA